MVTQRLMPGLSYEFSQKYFGTKLVPIERSCNPEHFDMHLETVQRDFVSMVPMAVRLFKIIFY